MTPTRRRIAGLTVLMSIVALGAGCGGSSAPASTSGGSGRTVTVTGTVNVFAAASLQEAFTTLGKQFEAAHPGSKVVINFGPSSGLAQQIIQGAPADVFASASSVTMGQVVSAGDAATPTSFVKNVMEIAVPPDNPGHISGPKDLARPGVKVALCQVQVPCGATAVKVFANTGITVTPVTEELDVKSVLTKVELGEVDAGVVYVTDVRAAGDKVEGIAVPGSDNASTTYPIATLTKAPNRRGARAFVAYVLSPAGSAVLSAAGFGKP